MALKNFPKDFYRINKAFFGFFPNYKFKPFENEKIYICYQYQNAKNLENLLSLFFFVQLQIESD